MKIRSAMMVLISVLVLVFSSVAQAQDMPDVDLCFGLAEADCAAIEGATGDILLSAENFSIDYSIDLNVTGLPDGDILFSHSGIGSLAIDPTAEFPISMSLDTLNNIDAMGDTFTDPIPVGIVDGILYVQVEGAWQGVNLIEAMDDPEFAQMFEGLNDPEAMADEMMGEMPDMDPETMEALGALLSIDGFLSQTRSGDDFQFTADLGTLFTSPEFSEAITSAAEMDESGMVMGLGMMLPMLLEDGTIQLTRHLNTELNAVDRVELAIDGVINAAMMDPELEDPIVIDLDFSFQVGGINESPVEFAVPADVEMVDPSSSEF